MPTNRYLIVAGGTGKGLLGKRDALNFRHEWQLDVESEKFNGDPAHFTFVALDTFIGTSGELAHYYRTRHAGGAANQQHASPYLGTRLETQAVKNHSSLYWKNVPAAMLRYGLAQEPATGAGAARHPDNENNLRATLAPITEDVGTDTTVDVWIVSSTAGGTGQGIHRYIGALVADIVSTTNTTLHLHFVQIGQTTYVKAGDKCILNTFMGVAADVAFSFLVKDINRSAVPAWYYLDLRDVGVGDGARKLRAELVEMSIKTIMNQNLSIHLNQLVINNGGLPFVLARTGFWGKDFDETSKYKQTLNATLAKLNHLLMPAEEMPARAQTLVATTAESDKPKFKETANYSPAIDKAQRISAVTAWLAENNKVPAYAAAGAAAPSPNATSWPPELRARAADLASSWKAAFKTMGISVDQLIASSSFKPTRNGLPTEQDLAGRRIPGTDTLNQNWEAAVLEASDAKLWCHQLLEGLSSVDDSPALLAQFMGLAQQAAKAVKNILHSSAKKAQLLAPVLGKLVEVLAKIAVLEKALEQTQAHLDEALRSAKQTRDFAAETLAALAADPDLQPTILAANLSDVLNEVSGETWLKTLHRRAETADATGFRKAVLAGATGLTRNGLREVLDLPPTADAAEIAAEIVKEPAEVTVGGEKAGAKQVAPIYWQRSKPGGITSEYFYRLIPKVDTATQSALSDPIGEIGKLIASNNITLAFEEMGRTGLYVMAFHGVSLSHQRGSDYFSAPKYMLRPMLNYVRRELDNWENDPARIGAAPTGNYNVIAAGATGEPLDLVSLIAADLTEAEIAKLASYYLMYSNSGPKGEPHILDGAAAVSARRTWLLESLRDYL